MKLRLGTAIADFAKAGRRWEALLPKVGGAIRPRQKTTVLTEVLAFGTNPGGLRMWVFVPRSVRPHPALVVVLHGCTQAAAGYNYHSGWSQLAEQGGFIVLFAEQQTANNPNLCFNWFVPGDIARGEGELLSIRQMIQSTVASRRVDERRVFITGLSAGAAMANAMLASYPEVFAGGAIIAGLPYGCAGNVMEALSAMKSVPMRSGESWGDGVRSASSHKGPWPIVSVWHGAGDLTVALSNGRAVASQWANVHGLSETDFEDTPYGPDTTRRVWPGKDGRPAVELLTVRRLGHGTPLDPTGRSGPPSGVAGPFMLDAGVSSTLTSARSWGLID